MKGIFNCTILLLVCSSISGAALPSEGYFVFTPYSDAKCTLSVTTPAGVYSSSQKCWATTSTASLAGKDWNTSTWVLSMDLFNTKSDCSGTPMMSNAHMKCDGSCVADALAPNRFVTCVYINLPSKGTFTFKGYTDNACKTKEGTDGVYSSSNLCWQTSTTTSMVPLNWDSTNKALTLFGYGSNGSCTGGAINTGVGTTACNGNCLADAIKPGKFYTCSYSFSQNIKSNVALILFAVIFFLF